MNEKEKQAIRTALAEGPKTTPELMLAAGLEEGNLALFQDIAAEEQRDGRMRRSPTDTAPTRWEATR